MREREREGRGGEREGEGKRAGEREGEGERDERGREGGRITPHSHLIESEGKNVNKLVQTLASPRS